jgi:hypothetical protein
MKSACWINTFDWEQMEDGRSGAVGGIYTYVCVCVCVCIMSCSEGLNFAFFTYSLCDVTATHFQDASGKSKLEKLEAL